MSNKSDLRPWKVLDSKIIHSTPWLEVIEDKCLADDKELTYTFSRRIDEGPLIIAEENDKLWLVRQYRHPIKKIIWQFPAEGKYKDESWEQAAKRGLKEELLFEAKTWHDLGQFYVDPGGLDQKYHAYIATDLTKIQFSESHQQNEDEVENLEIQSFSRSEIDDLIKAGELCDSWTLSGLFLYDRYKLISL
ncbi:MAG: NUDIX hydrolase [Candidatus Woesebacteria bacterium]